MKDVLVKPGSKPGSEDSLQAILEKGKSVDISGKTFHSYGAYASELYRADGEFLGTVLFIEDVSYEELFEED